MDIPASSSRCDRETFFKTNRFENNCTRVKGSKTGK